MIRGVNTTDADLDQTTSGHADEIETLEVPWTDDDAVRLRTAFDDEMADRYGTAAVTTETTALLLEDIFSVDNDSLVACVLVRVAGVAAAHGALFSRPELDAIEIRKVVVDPAFRGRRLGHRLMEDLERRAAALGAPRVVLDTGPKQPDAIALYESRGFTRIDAFEPYVSLARAMCFEKRLIAPAGRTSEAS